MANKSEETNILWNTALWAWAIVWANWLTNNAIFDAIWAFVNKIGVILSSPWSQEALAAMWTAAPIVAPILAGGFGAYKWMQQFLADFKETWWFIWFLKWGYNWIEKLALYYWLPMSVIAIFFWLSSPYALTAAGVWVWMWWAKKLAQAWLESASRVWELPGLAKKATIETVKSPWTLTKWATKKAFSGKPKPTTA